MQTPTIIVPRPDLFTMDCGNCGCKEFNVVVKPDMQTGQAKVVGMKCCKCAKPFSLDDKSGLEGTGKFKLQTRG